jgi:glutathione S-transferase
MLKLYGGARSRASIVRWYLEELEVPYEFVLLDMQAAEHRQPDFLSLNPFGKVPVLTDGDFKLWESGAILLYLMEKYGDQYPSLEQRAEMIQWVLFANATLGPGIFEEATREQELPRLFSPLDQIFEQQPYLLGSQFSVADVAVGSTLVYSSLLLKLDLSVYPAMVNYTKHLSARPACQKTMFGQKT